MTAPRRICVVTGSRADYGLLHWPMRLIADDPDLALQVAATGMHLAVEFGSTVDEITADGFTVDARVYSLVDGDTPAAVAKAIGRGVIGFADALARLGPDILLVLGDRYEILAAVEAALIHRIPVAHLCGGDLTEGAFDDQIRHAITKMSHLHFVSNADAARRVRQMGEDPARVHCVGSPGLDRIAHMAFRDRVAVFADIGFVPRARNLLVTYHPETLDRRTVESHADALFAGLDTLGPDTGLIVTGPNADTHGRALTRAVREKIAARPNACFHASLGQTRYLEALAQVDAVVGNSSSGLYEAPSFGIPTVNIGDRQAGRARATSVFDCPVDPDAIAATLARALSTDCRGTVNPYGDGAASPRIVAALKAVEDPAALIRKTFFDIPVTAALAHG